MKKSVALVMAVLAGQALADERLDYLQGDGTAFIDTKYMLTAADTVEVEFMVQDKELCHIFGARMSADNENFSLSVGKSSDKYFLIGDYSRWYYQHGRLQVEVAEQTGKRMKATIGNAARLIERYDGSVAWTNRAEVGEGAKLATVSSCLLFHLNGATFTDVQPFRGRIYSFKIIHNGETAMELLPYERNGVCGFRDRKTGAFLTPSAGAFTGPKLGRQTEYIEGDGEAYIDTGLSLGSHDAVTVEFMAYRNETMHIFGSRAAASKDNFSSAIAQIGGNWMLMNDFDSNNYCRYNVSTDDLLNNRVRLLSSFDERRVEVVGTDKVWTDTKSLEWHGFSTPGSCYLCYISGSPFADVRKFDGRLYGFKIVRDGVTLLDMVPWKRGDEAGMRDLIGGEFFGNAAPTGAFTAKELPKPGMILLFR